MGLLVQELLLKDVRVYEVHVSARTSAEVVETEHIDVLLRTFSRGLSVHCWRLLRIDVATLCICCVVGILSSVWQMRNFATGP